MLLGSPGRTTPGEAYVNCRIDRIRPWWPATPGESPTTQAAADPNSHLRMSWMRRATCGLEVIRDLRNLPQLPVHDAFVDAVEESPDIHREGLEDRLEDVRGRDRLVVLELRQIRLFDADGFGQLWLGEVPLGPQLLDSFADVHVLLLVVCAVRRSGRTICSGIPAGIRR